MKAEIEMTTILCAHCGMPFAITKDKEERLRKCHNTFYCPDGHLQRFPGKTEEEKLREQVTTLERSKRELEEKVVQLQTPKKRSPKKKS